MEEILYNSLDAYFKTLSKLGYVSTNQVYKLLILSFYKHYVYEDYRGYIAEEDYKDIESALNCLFGTTCLIPYPDYLKMGKLKLGEIGELNYRIKAAEEFSNSINDRLKLNDAVTGNNTKRIVEAANRLDIIESTRVVKGKPEIKIEVDDIQL